MKTVTLKIVRIGNSLGVRMPASMLGRYRIKNEVAAEQWPEGIFLRSLKEDRLSWEGTARAMSAGPGGEFVDLEKTTVADGLAALDPKLRKLT